MCCDGALIAMDAGGLSATEAAACFTCCAPEGTSEGVPDGAVRRIAVGELSIVCLLDGGGTFDARMVFSNVREAEWSADSSAPRDELHLACATAFVRCPSGVNVLIDAGLGIFAPPGGHTSKHDLRLLLWRAVGITPADIDFVIHSHLHRDHTGWCVDELGEPLFQNARHVIQAREMEFWSATESRRRRVNFEAVIRPLMFADMILLVDGCVDVTPTIRVEMAPGHTPGHQVVWITSPCGSASAVWIGDALHHAVQLRHPKWCTIFDHDEAESVATRVALLERLAASSHILVSPHFPFQRLAGRIVAATVADAAAKASRCYKFSPLENPSVLAI